MDSQVVPGRYGVRFLVPGGRDIGVRTVENGHGTCRAPQWITDRGMAAQQQTTVFAVDEERQMLCFGAMLAGGNDGGEGMRPAEGQLTGWIIPRKMGRTVHVRLQLWSRVPRCGPSTDVVRR